MADLITTAGWDMFNQAINDAGDTFNKTIITWRKFTYFLNEFNEDNVGNFEDLEIPVLVSDNFFHTWPITAHSATGELDKETMVIILNRKQMDDLGYINAYGNFDFKPDMDRFVLKGIVYKCEGWTDMSSSDVAGTGENLLIMIILKREETSTGTNPINP